MQEGCFRQELKHLSRVETDLNDENGPVTESESSEGAMQQAHVV